MTPLGRSVLPGHSRATSRAAWFCFFSLKHSLKLWCTLLSLTCWYPEGSDIGFSRAIFHMMHHLGSNSGMGQGLKTWQVPPTTSLRTSYRAIKPFLSYYSHCLQPKSMWICHTYFYFLGLPEDLICPFTWACCFLTRPSALPENTAIFLRRSFLSILKEQFLAVFKI